MPSTVFAVPILHGKTEAWKSAVAEMTGPRKNEYIEARRALGISKEVVCLQQTPHGDFVCVYLEAANVSNILQDMVQATDVVRRGGPKRCTWYGSLSAATTRQRSVRGLDLDPG